MWFFLAVASAVCQSISDVLNKRGLREVDEFVVAWAVAVVSALILLPVVIGLGIPELGDSFWIALCFVCVLDTVGLLLYLQAIKSSELSIILPLQMFTPLFLLLTAPLILGEYPNLFGACGVVLIVSGSYVLNLRAAEKGFMAPFRALFCDRGAQRMLLCAALWSICVNFHKICIINSSPIFYVVMHQVFVAVLVTPFLLYRLKKNPIEISRSMLCLAANGFAIALTFSFAMLAMQNGLVIYVIAIKRTSVLLSMCLGFLMFREMNIRGRLAGASIMIAGTVLTVL